MLDERESGEGDVTGLYEKERWEGGHKKVGMIWKEIWEEFGGAWKREKYGNPGIWKLESLGICEYGGVSYGRIERERKRRVDDGKKRRGSRACP